MLLVSEDEKRTQALRRALRERKANVGDLRSSESDPVALRGADLVVVDARSVDATRDRVAAMRNDVRARWAAVLTLDYSALVSDAGVVHLSALEAKVAPLTATDRALTERAKREHNFEADLAPLGPTRTLRALGQAGPTLLVELTSEDMKASVTLSHELLVCAFMERGGERWEAWKALARILGLTDAKVRVSRLLHPSAMNVMEPLDQALQAAAKERHHDAAGLAREERAQEKAPAKAPMVHALSPAQDLRVHAGRTLLGVAPAQLAAQAPKPASSRYTYQVEGSERIKPGRTMIGLSPGLPALGGDKNAALPAAGPLSDALASKVPENTQLERATLPAPSRVAHEQSTKPVNKIKPANKTSAANAATAWSESSTEELELDDLLPDAQPPAPPKGVFNTPPQPAPSAPLAPPASANEKPRALAPQPQPDTPTNRPAAKAKAPAPQAPAPAPASAPEPAAVSFADLPTERPPPMHEALSAAQQDNPFRDVPTARADLLTERALRERISLGDTPTDPAPPRPAASPLEFEGDAHHNEDTTAVTNVADLERRAKAADRAIAAGNLDILGDDFAGFVAEDRHATKTQPFDSSGLLQAIDEEVDGVDSTERETQPSPAPRPQSVDSALPPALARPKKTGRARTYALMFAGLLALSAGGWVLLQGTGQRSAALGPMEPSPATGSEALAKAEAPSETPPLGAAPKVDEKPEPTAEEPTQAPTEDTAPAEPAAQPAPQIAAAPPSAPAEEEAATDGPNIPAGASADVLIRDGNKLLAQGNAAHAKAYYEAAVQREAANPHAHAGLSEALLKLGDANAAEQAAEAAIRLRPKRARYRVLLGDALKAQGKVAEAKAAWNKALELDPNDRDAQRRLK